MLKTAAKWIPAKEVVFLDDLLSRVDTGMTGRHHKGDVFKSVTTEILGGEKIVSYSYTKDTLGSLSIRKTTSVIQNGKTTKKSTTYSLIDPTKVQIT